MNTETAATYLRKTIAGRGTEGLPVSALPASVGAVLAQLVEAGEFEVFTVQSATGMTVRKVRKA